MGHNLLSIVQNLHTQISKCSNTLTTLHQIFSQLFLPNRIAYSWITSAICPTQTRRTFTQSHLLKKSMSSNPIKKPIFCIKVLHGFNVANLFRQSRNKCSPSHLKELPCLGHSPIHRSPFSIYHPIFCI